MKAKQYLLQIAKIQARIDRLIDIIEQMRAAEQRVTAQISSDGTRGSSAIKDRIAEMVARRIDRECDLFDKVNELIDAKRKITEEIEAVDDPREVAILFKRYVECKSLVVVACEMNYSYEYTRHLHGFALAHFEERMKCG